MKHEAVLKLSKEGILFIDNETADKIIEYSEPKGQYVTIEDNQFVAIDNLSGDAWTEDFEFLDTAVDWLKGKIDTEEAYEQDGKLIMERLFKEDGMKNYFISYGVDSDKQPYKCGYTKVKARTMSEAVKKHNHKYGYTKEGFGRYCSCYPENEFKETSMYNQECWDVIE